MTDEQATILIDQLLRESEQARQFIADGLEVPYWEGVRDGIDIALAGFRAVGISVNDVIEARKEK